MSYDCSAITERLFCGSQIAAREHVQDIKALGISHIIDCQSESFDTSVPTFDRPLSLALLVPGALREGKLRPGFALRDPKTEGFGYIWDPTADDGGTKPDEWFARGVDFAMGALAHPGYNVLCHCQGGVNRGPSMAYAIMRAQGWDSASALQRLRDMRPVVNIGYRHDAERALVHLGWTRYVEPT